MVAKELEVRKLIPLLTNQMQGKIEKILKLPLGEKPLRMEVCCFKSGPA